LRDVIDLSSLRETLGFGQVTIDFQALNLHKRSELKNLASVNYLSRRRQYLVDLSKSSACGEFFQFTALMQIESLKVYCDLAETESFHEGCSNQ